MWHIMVLFDEENHAPEEPEESDFTVEGAHSKSPGAEVRRAFGACVFALCAEITWGAGSGAQERRCRRAERIRLPKE